VADAYVTALGMLARRELSAAQLRQRLARRQFAPDDIASALARLTADGTVDDRRVARAYARMEASIKARGRRRVLQAVQRLGITSDVAEDAVAEVYGELDEEALFTKALDKRLRGMSIRDLDDKARARIVRQLSAQGYEPSRILRALRR
jgi:regulatory protein